MAQAELRFFSPNLLLVTDQKVQNHLWHPSLPSPILNPLANSVGFAFKIPILFTSSIVTSPGPATNSPPYYCSSYLRGLVPYSPLLSTARAFQGMSWSLSLSAQNFPPAPCLSMRSPPMTPTMSVPTSRHSVTQASSPPPIYGLCTDSFFPETISPQVLRKYCVSGSLIFLWSLLKCHLLNEMSYDPTLSLHPPHPFQILLSFHSQLPTI